ncbi:hypothetical protein [Ruminococcus sp.]|uniref:immunity protein Imm33 domain-containing protein n=1 Tax=Ruminococcus sp. TaxID=41978 RepID=UPI0025DEB782|nr:hypothetical protein [Ruminococcus sp.]MBQ8966823.1 hypothetical protein [Ruminococcus sp.]
MLITYTEEINGINYTFSAEEALRPFAEPLLEAIEYIPTERITDGFRIRAGFSTFLLSEHGKGYDIAAPDYTDDPLTALNTDLTLALHIQYRQVLLLHKYGVVGKAVHFYDKLAVAKGALEKPNISMQRFGDLGGSGWSVQNFVYDEKGSARLVDAEDYEGVYAYELLTRRPELIDVLCLPDGYIAVFKGEELVQLLDDENNELIQHREH